jgi:hypothetical protein
MGKQRTNYNKVVGRNGQEIYILDCTFKHDDGFQGAVGTVVVGLTQQQVDYMYSDEGLLERWYDNFHPNGDRTEEEFLCDVRNEISWGNFEPFEQYHNDNELLELQYSKDNNFVAFEVIGCGRCFKQDQTFEEVLNEELLQEILKYEGAMLDTERREAVIAIKDKLKKIDEIIHKLKEIDVDGETLQYIIREVGMEDQMLRQLVMTLSLQQTLQLIQERVELLTNLNKA